MGFLIFILVLRVIKILEIKRFFVLSLWYLVFVI